MNEKTTSDDNQANPRKHNKQENNHNHEHLWKQKRKRKHR